MEPMFTLNAVAGTSLAVLLLLCVCRFCCALRTPQPFDRLGRHIGRDAPVNRMQSLCDAGPVGRYRRTLEADDTCCVICLNEYEEGDRLRTLGCRHYFHTGCIDPWLLIKQTCPLCMTDVLGPAL